MNQVKHLPNSPLINKSGLGQVHILTHLIATLDETPKISTIWLLFICAVYAVFPTLIEIIPRVVCSL